MRVMQKRSNDSGATATEYVLLIAGIAAVIVASVFAFGHFLNSTYTSTCQSISSAVNPNGCN
jgi:pilus assembly protein Flp/PilA